MNFKKENGSSIKLESIMDNGTALDITGYKEKDLLTIGADGKYTRTSIEPSDTKASSNNDVNSNIEPDNQVITATSNNSDELITQEAEIPNTEQKTPNNANTLDEACKDLELQPGCENENTDPPPYKTKYKVLALKYHPDKCRGNNLSKEECESNESKFKIITEAYEKLTDYTDENSKRRESENTEATQPANASTLAIEKPLPQISLPENVYSFGNTSELPTDIPVPPENNPLQVALRNGGKTKRRKAGKKNKSKRVRFMSRRNRRR